MIRPLAIYAASKPSFEVCAPSAYRVKDAWAACLELMGADLKEHGWTGKMISAEEIPPTGVCRSFAYPGLTTAPDCKHFGFIK